MQTMSTKQIIMKKQISINEIIDTANKPFENCVLTANNNNGNKYLLMFQDNLTKFNKAILLPNQEASIVAHEFVTKIVLEHGILAQVPTDQGTNFLSSIFKNMCKL